jgi:predicted Fe-S protein YdhL (DUF1289 family)
MEIPIGSLRVDETRDTFQIMTATGWEYITGTDLTSPCINVCKIDVRTGYCDGCFRTLDEIETWTLLDRSEKEALIEELKIRSI